MMEYWAKVTILLCMYGLFLYVKPSEPFLTPYLQGPVHNLTEGQVVNEVYPVWIYSYLALLLPVFLLTDYLRYKPIIICQALGHIACWLLLLFGRGVPLMQLMQVFYAVATAGEVGYYSYLYSIVDESHYQFVTSCVRATTLFGYFIGSLLGQLLVSLAGLDYFYLNAIALANVCIAFVIALFLPMPKRSLFFFEQSQEVDDNEADELKAVEADEGIGTSFHAKRSEKSTLLSLWSSIKNSYKDATLLRWSIWWALSTCGWLLVVNYIQNLWETIRPSSSHDIYNGAVESVATALGAAGAFGVGYLKVDWSRWGESALGMFSLVKCGLLLVMYFTTDIWVCYAAYISFIILYNVVITITQFQIAVGLNTRRFALVFGVNTFAALLLNAIFTLVLIDKAGLGLDVNTQFVVYSGYFGITALVFLVHAVYNWLSQRQTEDSIVKSSL